MGQAGTPLATQGECERHPRLPAPFPIWVAASVLVWLLILFAFLFAYGRWLRGG